MAERVRASSNRSRQPGSSVAIGLIAFIGQGARQLLHHPQRSRHPFFHRCRFISGAKPELETEKPTQAILVNVQSAHEAFLTAQNKNMTLLLVGVKRYHIQSNEQER